MRLFAIVYNNGEAYEDYQEWLCCYVFKTFLEASEYLLEKDFEPFLVTHWSVEMKDELSVGFEKIVDGEYGYEEYIGARIEEVELWEG